MIGMKALFQEGVNRFWLAVTEQQNMFYILIWFLVASSTVLRSQGIYFLELTDLHWNNRQKYNQN